MDQESSDSSTRGPPGYGIDDSIANRRSTTPSENSASTDCAGTSRGVAATPRSYCFVPDALVPQILAAATYPAEMDQADRWLQKHSYLHGEQLAAVTDKRAEMRNGGELPADGVNSVGKVENDSAALRILSRELGQQDVAVKSSERTAL